jgi:hypothetical protein
MVTHSNPTYHNDGKSMSQVDYIFSNNNTTIVMEHGPINSSSHLPVISNLTKTLKATAKKGKKSHTTYTLLWGKVDKKEYQNIFNQLRTCNWNNYDVNAFRRNGNTIVIFNINCIISIGSCFIFTYLESFYSFLVDKTDSIRIVTGQYHSTFWK